MARLLEQGDLGGRLERPLEGNVLVHHAIDAPPPEGILLVLELYINCMIN